MKYYVKSGELEKTILMANSPIDAAKQAIMLAEGEELDYFFYVSKKGIRGPSGQNIVMDIGMDYESQPEWSIQLGEVIGSDIGNDIDNYQGDSKDYFQGDFNEDS